MEFRILGPLEVGDGRDPVSLDAPKQRALLGVLLLHANEVVPTERLIDELWGDRSPPTAVKLVQTYVSQLRRVLGATSIETRPPGYLLRVEEDALDVTRFRRLATEARRLAASGQSERAQALYGEALALWRGPPLADVSLESFARNEVDRLAEERLSVVIDRIDCDLALGRHNELVPELDTLVKQHPLHERLRAQLMLSLYRSGRQGDALATYQKARRVLAEQLGLEPGEPLRQLERQILNHDPGLQWAPATPKAEAPAVKRGWMRTAAALGAVLVAAAFAAGLLLGREGAAAPEIVPNSLVKIDAATNEIVDVLPVGRNPGDVAVVGRYVFVASEDDATLTRIDVGSGEVTTSGASGADAGLAGAGDRFVWTASLRRARVTRVNVESLLPIDGVPLASNIFLAFVALGGGSLWVSQFSPPAVLRYRLRTLRIERRYSFGAFEVPIEVTYGHGAAWVGLAGSNALLRIDAGTGRTRTIPVGRFLGDLAVGFGSVWTVSADRGTVWRIDAVSEEVEEIIGVGSVPFGVATGAGSVWVTNNGSGTVSRIDPGTDEVEATIETGFFPKWLAVGGGYVWVGIGGEAFEP